MRKSVNEITVAELLTIHSGKFYRLTNESETHNSVTYKTGLNIDPIPFNPHGDCQAGGMYFFHEDGIDISLCSKPWGLKWLREVTFPEDARIYVEGCKFKADKFILGKRETVPVWAYMKSVINHSDSLVFVPEEMRTEEILLNAVKRNGYALGYISKDMKTEEMCLEAVKRNGCSIVYVPEEMRTEEIYLEAVKQNGFAIQYVPVNMKTVEICSEAVKQTYHAIDYVPSNMLTDEMRLRAVTHSRGVVIARSL